MKILVADTQYPFGHQNLNNHIIKILSNISDVDMIKVLNYNEYYHKFNDPKISLLKLHYLLFCRNEYLRYILSFINAVILGIRLITIEYDKVVFFTFDTLSFGILRLFIRKPIYIFHHNNTDHLQNKYKYIFFKTYANNVHHILFADFIRTYLLKRGVKDSLLHTIPHPLPITSSHSISDKKETDGSIKRFIALGHGNDESLISAIISYENKKRLLEFNKIELVIRSRQSSRNLPTSIKIISHYLTREEYDSLYTSATGVLILFSSNFKNRYSGTLLDAFYYRKNVIGRDIPIVQLFTQMYPKSCYVFKDEKDLVERLCSKLDFDENEYNNFLSIHSDNSIQHCLNEILL